MATNFKVTKALIPVAGLGTRFLPATKAMPKEMLPLIDKPVIQYVVEEAVDTGLTDILMITGRNKSSLENHFDRVTELEQTLKAKGDSDRLEQVQESSDLAHIYYTRQGDPKGLGHAVLTGKLHIGNHSFAVLLGDDVIDAKDPLLSRMIEIHEATGDNVIALMEVPAFGKHRTRTWRRDSANRCAGRSCKEPGNRWRSSRGRISRQPLRHWR